MGPIAVSPPLGAAGTPISDMPDLLTKYLFADRSVRLQTVDLDVAWQTMQQGHDYPPAVGRLLGELVAASLLLSANLKFDGTLAMQLQGDGDVRLVVVECRANLDVRATVKLREDAVIADDAGLQALVNPDGGGRFTVVLDPQHRQPSQQPYQGIVPLEGDTVAQALEHYMASSEQLQTRLWLAADGERSTGVLLQRLPNEGGHGTTAGEEPDETWNRALHLAQTLKREELLTTPTPTLVHRLFWQEELTAFEPMPARFHCPCSREKVANVLRVLGQVEVDDIIAESGHVEVKCDYCLTAYLFDPVDCAEVFASNDPASVRHKSGNTH